MRGAAVALALALGACAAGPVLTKELGGYIARHPQLTAPEVDRLMQRQVIVGDPLDRVQAAWSGCEIERVVVEGVIEIVRVHVPLGERTVRIGEETVEEGGSLQMTFERHVLKSFLVIEAKYQG